MVAVNPRRIRPTRAEVRERILDAALVGFAANGFGGTTIDDVAAAAGFTKGAVYSNFASKDDLFFALVDRQIALRVAMVQELLTPVDELNADTTRLIGERLTEAIHGNTDHQILFFEYWLRAIRDPATQKRFAAHRRAIRERLTEQFNAIEHLLPDAFSVVEITQLVMALRNGIAIEEVPEPGSTAPGLIGKLLTHLIAPENGQTTRRHPN